MPAGAALNTVANAAGGTCHSRINAGAARPIAWRSSPSSSATARQQANTRTWNTPMGCASMQSETSILGAGERRLGVVIAMSGPMLPSPVSGGARDVVLPQ